MHSKRKKIVFRIVGVVFLGIIILRSVEPLEVSVRNSVFHVVLPIDYITLTLSVAGGILLALGFLPKGAGRE